MLSTEATGAKDLAIRLSRTKEAFNHMRSYWRGAGDWKWRKKVLLQVIVPMLIYASDVINLSKEDLMKMDATYYSLLRRALHVPSTYYTKVVNPEAKTIKNKELDAIAQIPPPSSLTRLRRMRRQLNIFRQGVDDLKMSLLVDRGLNERRIRGVDRMMRATWLRRTVDDVWTTLQTDIYFHTYRRHPLPPF